MTNRIQPLSVDFAQCPAVTDQAEIAERYQQLLGDESRLSATGVEVIYFPGSVPEAAGAMKELHEAGRPCVISAGRTGIAGAAAPIDTPAIVSLASLNRPLAVGRDGDEYYVRVEPGMTLAALTDMLRKKGCIDLPGASAEESAVATALLADDDLQLWFPVNPTETSAHIGGIVATNASGARTYHYGPTRDWVRAMTVALADGRILKLRRGDVVADHGIFLLEDGDGGETVVEVPDVEQPATKATLGYPLRRDMDLIDLFIGSEGTLGMVLEIELRLALRPKSVIGVLVVAEEEKKALELVKKARSSKSIAFDAIEFFDHAALQLLQQKKNAEGAGSHIPDLPSWNGCGVYFEFSGSEDDTEDGCLVLEGILAEVGLSLDDTWAALEPKELAAQRLFRHAVPEAVNSIIGRRKALYPGLHKVGTDMAVPDEMLDELFEEYRSGLKESGIEAVIFGHIGDNHVHVNMLPENMEQLNRAKLIYQQWAQRVVAMGGAVAAEHGIGRMKKDMLAIQYDEGTLDIMQAVKNGLDPRGILSPGVLLND